MDRAAHLEARRVELLRHQRSAREIEHKSIGEGRRRSSSRDHAAFTRRQRLRDDMRGVPFVRGHRRPGGEQHDVATANDVGPSMRRFIRRGIERRDGDRSATSGRDP
jgi:hypothetical protein